MKIHQLQKSKWLKDKARRRWRGNGTGTGNYSGRGLKGQKARSWHSMKPFFEGWQTSIVQRLPKARWFTRYYKLVQDVVIVNLGALDADVRITDTMEVNKQVLKDLGYIKSIKAFVKLLWHGDYAKHLTFKDIDAFSASAKIKMDKPGTVHSASHKAPVKVVKDAKSKVWKLKIKTPAEKKSAKERISVKKIAIPKKTVSTPIAKPLKVEKVEKKAPAVKKVVEKKVVEKKTVKEDKVPVTKKPASVAKKPTSVAKKAPSKKTK